ncbi:GGDEF domain-containing protein [Bacillus sp. FJAT-27245]|uniref:GGDEF domain-containing protein n=1 Tax=Bacillus sp. FJAT-27245 TaxID=1684144 RepID=UPI0006A7610E|nr:GGDEF domain-containing protein [Bacillus sp. FJAT-27245]
MKFNIKNIYQSDHTIEIIFSSLRWFFLVLAVIVFAIQYNTNPEPYKLKAFMALLVFGLAYMGISDYHLHKSLEGSKIYTLMTKGGPFFDFIAFSALLPLTGGLESPLFPIAYLIILHIVVYWRFIGGIISSLVFILVYSIMFYIQHPEVSSLQAAVIYICQVAFLLLMGCLGGIIVSRERKHYSEKNLLEEAATRDYLTNLLNHRSFQECLRKNLQNGEDFHLVLADIDKFKSINDKYGHVTGDMVLRKIGEILTSFIPEEHGKVFRYGGEEFAMILYIKRQAEVNRLLVEIQQAIANYTFHARKGSFSLTMSFGCCRQNGEMPTQLVEKADKLLYEAKNRGRNQIVM